MFFFQDWMLQISHFTEPQNKWVRRALQGSPSPTPGPPLPGVTPHVCESIVQTPREPCQALWPIPWGACPRASSVTWWGPHRTYTRVATLVILMATGCKKLEPYLINTFKISFRVSVLFHSYLLVIRLLELS